MSKLILKMIIFLIIFVSTAFSDIKIEKTSRSFILSFSAESLTVQSRKSERDSIYIISAQEFLDYSPVPQLTIPIRHFSFAMPEKVSPDQIQIRILETKPIHLPSNLIKELPSSLIQNIRNDMVLTIPTVEFDVFPVIRTTGGGAVIIIKAEISVHAKTTIPERLVVGSKLTSSLISSLSARINNLSFYSFQHVPQLRKTQAVTYDFGSGQWFTLKYRKESFYRLSLSDLKNNGLQASEIPFDEVQLYSYQGKDLPLATDSYPEGLIQIPVIIDDKDNDGIWDDNEFIYFYARPGNHYEYDNSSGRFEFQEYHFDENFYVILHIGDGESVVPETKDLLNPAGSIPVQTTRYLYHFERNINNILSSGLEWYDVRFSGSKDQKTLSFTLPEQLEIIQDSMAVAQVRLKGGNGSFYSENTNVWHYFDLTLNVTPIGSNIVIRANGSTVYKTTIPGNSIQHDNTLFIDYRSTQSFGYAYFDYLDLQFYVRLKYYPFFLPVIAPAVQKKIAYNILNTGTDPEQYLLCDITDPVQYQYVPLQISGDHLVFIDSTGNIPHIYGFMKKSDVPLPDDIRLVSSHPNLRDPFFSYDMLIITAPELIDQAEQIKSIYENRPLRPIRSFIVTTENIYLEFSSGSVHPLAIRNYIRFLALHATPPSQVVLLGNGHFDYKHIIYSLPNYIPPYEKEHPFEINSKPLDILFTDINRFDNSLISILPDIPIGRIPANSPEDAENYVDKLSRYESLFPENIIQNSWRSRILLVADDEVSTFDKSEYYHLGFSEALVSEKRIPAYYDILKLYLYDYPLAPGGLGRAKPLATQDLISYFNSGVQLINYYGHGSPTTWAHETVFTIDRDGEKIQNPYKNPIIVAGTCDFGTFDQPNHPSASVQLLNMYQRGAIAVLSASRPSYASGNRSLTYSFFSNFYIKSVPLGTNTIGQAFIKAVIATGGYDNSQSYNLLGMPALTPVMDAYKISLDSLSKDTLKALSTVHFKASVKDTSDRILTDFNGKCYLLVRDAASDPKTSGPYTYQHAGSVIFKGIYTVRNGVVEGDFIIPKSIKYKNDPSGKIFLYAISEASTSAVGYKDSLLVMDSEQGIKDSKGPDLKIQFKENPSFVNGDILPPNATLEVEVFDEHGINTTNEIGHEILLIIDGEQKYNLTEFFIYKENSYQKGVIEYPLPPLSTGRHSLKLRIWDNLNNPTETEFNFEVISAQGQNETLGLYHVVNYPNPMTDDTYFTFSLLNSEPQATVRVKIFTITGRLIRTIETMLTTPQGFQKVYWDGRDENGEIPANGVYLYKIIVDNGVRKTSKIEKLMILR